MAAMRIGGNCRQASTGTARPFGNRGEDDRSASWRRRPQLLQSRWSWGRKTSN